MKRWRLLPTLLAATVACSDSPVTPIRSTRTLDEGPEIESIPGYLLSPRLLQSGTQLIPLIGDQIELLTDLVGAEVLVTGSFDPEDGALMIRDFMVLSVDGLPAFDGILDWEADLFMIHTLRGETVSFGDLPPDLTEHVGKRVWLTVTPDRVPVRYGVLQM